MHISWLLWLKKGRIDYSCKAANIWNMHYSWSWSKLKRENQLEEQGRGTALSSTDEPLFLISLDVLPPERLFIHLSLQQTSCNSDHAASFKLETYIKVNFRFTFPFPSSFLLNIINCFACASWSAFICSNHKFILGRQKEKIINQ